ANDIRIESMRFDYEDYLYRTPIKFGGSVVNRVTLINVHSVVRNSAGKSAKGFGSMPLGNVWSFPSKTMSYDMTLGAMKALAGRIERIFAGYKEFGHPVDIGLALEPACLTAAGDVTRELRLTEPIPKLCSLVTLSPFDGAVHDAYGKLHGVSSY